MRHDHGEQRGNGGALGWFTTPTEEFEGRGTEMGTLGLAGGGRGRGKKTQPRGRFCGMERGTEMERKRKDVWRAHGRISDGS